LSKLPPSRPGKKIKPVGHADCPVPSVECTFRSDYTGERRRHKARKPGYPASPQATLAQQSKAPQSRATLTQGARTMMVRITERRRRYPEHRPHSSRLQLSGISPGAHGNRGSGFP
jgi:hypothetical protein